MIALLAAHGVVGILILAFTGRLQRWAWALGAAPMLAMLGYAVAQWGAISDGDPPEEHVTWVSGLDLALDVRLDGFGFLMTLIVSGIGVLVMAYSTRYFPPSVQSARIAGLLVLFSGSMLGLVLANHLLFLFLCWELTSITSWQLIGANNTDPAARNGALHALLVTSAGGLALLAGLVVLAQAAGTYVLSDMLEDPPSGGSVGLGLGLVLVGIMTKSAQFPTHAWLPGAMVAPTPVSTYLHSATMVKAGIYLAARLAPAFAAVGMWRGAIGVIGVTTMLLGGARALRQNDLKLLLAMGTISQLGFLLVMVGTGHPEMTEAGVVLLGAHALFKAALFLVVGIVDHQAGTRDIRQLCGLGHGWGPVKAVAVISAASMAGLPPLLGFVAKEDALGAFTEQGFWGQATLAGIVVGSVLTFAYSWRFVAAILPQPAPGAISPTPPRLTFTSPALVLGTLTVLGGLFVSQLNSLFGQASMSLDHAIHGVHLGLWHGFNLPLALSALIILVGVLVVMLQARIGRMEERLLPVSGDRAFALAIQGLNTLSRGLTRVVQNGSLPLYCAVILLTAVAIPGVTFLRNSSWPGWPSFAASPLQAVLALAIIGVAMGAATARRRFSAVLLLGGVGYLVGVLYIFQGDPDLALTQFSVETLLLVVFVLVLRKLPSEFKPQPGRDVFAGRIAVASVVAGSVFFITLYLAGPNADDPPPPAESTADGAQPAAGDADDSLADELIEMSEEDAGGANVVNVVLVDFRGFDTLGEISVLATAALGIFGLAMPSIKRRKERADGRSDRSGLAGSDPNGGDPR